METQLEARDIIEMIHRYTASNRQKVCFVGSFIAFNEKTDKVKTGSDILIAYGRKNVLRKMLDDLRDEIEDSADEEGFVNI